jgi:hypothetical protein
MVWHKVTDALSAKLAFFPPQVPPAAAAAAASDRYAVACSDYLVSCSQSFQ